MTLFPILRIFYVLTRKKYTITGGCHRAFSDRRDFKEGPFSPRGDIRRAFPASLSG
jgi:hypothetical protein